MQLSAQWFDEPGEAHEPTKEIELWLVGAGSDGNLRRRRAVARLRYVPEAQRLKANLAARQWLLKAAGNINVDGLTVLQTERCFVLGEALGDAEDPACNFFGASPGQISAPGRSLSAGELALNHLVYAASEDAMSKWEAFIREEFPEIVTEEQHRQLKEDAAEK